MTLRRPGLPPGAGPGRPARRGRAARRRASALVTLDAEQVATPGRPARRPRRHRHPAAARPRRDAVPLAGATLTDEDPAQPPCPSLGTVWRRYVPGAAAAALVTRHRLATPRTLTAFAGRVPTGDNVLDCVNRDGPRVAADERRRSSAGSRCGSASARSRPPGGEDARVRLSDGARRDRRRRRPGRLRPDDGRPGRRPAGACDRADVTTARVTGPAPARQRRRAATAPPRRRCAIRVRGASDVRRRAAPVRPGRRDLRQGGSRVRLKPGRQRSRLPRLRTIRPGRYRLRGPRRRRSRGERVVVRGTRRREAASEAHDPPRADRRPPPPPR